MSTSAQSTNAIAKAVLKRIGRKARKDPPRLSQKDADELHAHELDTMPRNGGCPVTTVLEFLDRLDSVVLCVADLRERYRQESKNDWWHMADLLGDLSDLRTALQGNVHSGVSQRSPVCKLVYLVEPSLPGLPSEAQLVAAAQALATMRNFRRRGTQACTPKEEAEQERVYALLRLERLQNLPIIAAPSIASAAKFKLRLEDVMFRVAYLRQSYETEQRSDWWHMADLLDDLADLLDAVRSNAHNSTQAIFSVVDLPYC